MDWTTVFSPHFLWMAVGLVLLIGEFVVPGVVIVFFGLGALLVGALCYFIDLNLNTQIALFLLSSIGMLLSLRNSISPVLLGKATDDGYEELSDVIGKRGKVIESISHGSAGRIEFHGSQWSAEASEDIPLGTSVVVIGRDNLTLHVRSDQCNA